jgi:hypothetical protein
VEAGLTLDVEQIASLYSEYRLIQITGWTLEYIRSLGMLTHEAILQFYEAEQALIKSMTKPKRKGR